MNETKTHSIHSKPIIIRKYKPIHTESPLKLHILLKLLILCILVQPCFSKSAKVTGRILLNTTDRESKETESSEISFQVSYEDAQKLSKGIKKRHKSTKHAILETAESGSSSADFYVLEKIPRSRKSHSQSHSNGKRKCIIKIDSISPEIDDSSDEIDGKKLRYKASKGISEEDSEEKDSEEADAHAKSKNTQHNDINDINDEEEEKQPTTTPEKDTENEAAQKPDTNPEGSEKPAVAEETKSSGNGSPLDKAPKIGGVNPLEVAANSNPAIKGLTGLFGGLAQH